MIQWPFPEREDTAVFTSRRILDGAHWVYYVTHDAEDGAWQFHPHDGLTPERDAAVVSLKTMVALDSSLRVVGDLPRGCYAWRVAPDAPWVRGAGDPVRRGRRPEPKTSS
jgi:hypothetical protein